MNCQILLFALHITLFISMTCSAPLEEDESTQVAECDKKLDSVNAYTDCSALIGTNWNCVNSAPIRIGNKEHSDRVIMSCGDSQPLFCCPVWGMVRCLLQQVKNNCNPQFGNQFHHQYRAVAFQPQIEQLHNQHCAKYHFASVECDEVLQFIRDPFKLENAALKSGLYPVFFANATNQNRLAQIRSSNGASKHSSHLWLVTISITTILICMFSDQL